VDDDRGTVQGEEPGNGCADPRELPVISATRFLSVFMPFAR